MLLMQPSKFKLSKLVHFLRNRKWKAVRFLTIRFLLNAKSKFNGPCLKAPDTVLKLSFLSFFISSASFICISEGWAGEAKVTPPPPARFVVTSACHHPTLFALAVVFGGCVYMVCWVFPVFKQKLWRFPWFQVAAACPSCGSPYVKSRN